MTTQGKTVCVAGASGLVGSNIIREALLRGYAVNGTMRNSKSSAKAPFLNTLHGATQGLQLFDAEMGEEGSFDDAVAGADCVFIATLIPMYAGRDGKIAREMDDDQGYAEIIMPTVDGCLNIMRSAIRHGLKSVVICSSTSSTNPTPPPEIKNEADHWSDEEEQCRAKKYTSATKTVMEKAAMKLAAENDVRLSILLPTGLYGPAVLPEHLEANPYAWLRSLLDGGEGRHNKMPNDSHSMIHLHDLAALFMAAYENPTASGRYYGVYDSWPWLSIYGELGSLIPNMKMPDKFIERAVSPTRFDFMRRDSLGVALRDIPTMLRETVQWLRTDPFKL